jgi:hypothetical protein
MAWLQTPWSRTLRGSGHLYKSAGPAHMGTTVGPTTKPARRIFRQFLLNLEVYTTE